MKFFKAKIEIEVIAQEPIEFSSLNDLVVKTTEDNWLGDYKIISHEEISKKEAKILTKKLGHDPSFFGKED